MYFGLNWLFGSNDDTELLNDNIIKENEYFEQPTASKPFDYDEYQWYNPADWFGYYDKNMSSYEERKMAEKESQNRILFYIITGLFGIYLIRR